MLASVNVQLYSRDSLRAALPCPCHLACYLLVTGWRRLRTRLQAAATTTSAAAGHLPAPLCSLLSGLDTSCGIKLIHVTDDD